MLRLFWVLVVFSLVGAGGYFGFRKWVGEERPVTYKTTPVARGTLISTVTATGSLEPLLNVLVGSQVSGTVIKWYADFNQRVELGFVLAELDQDRFKATFEQKVAAAKAAKAHVEESAAALADAVLKREHAEKNFAVNAASDLELKEAKIAEQQATAMLHAAEADVERAEADSRLSAVDVDRTIIRSPISGVVISRSIDEGQTVAASLQAPTLFTIANDLTKMRVNAAVSETDIGKIHEGGPSTFRVDAYPERRFKGTISQVRYAQTTVDNVVTYTTMIDVDNADLALRPGMTATISFEVARAEDAMLVPNAAMRFTIDAPAADLTNFNKPGKGRPMQPRVYKLADGKPVEVNVQPGLTDGSRTEVKSADLKEGDPVITEQMGGPKPAVGAQPRRFGP